MVESGRTNRSPFYIVKGSGKVNEMIDEERSDCQNYSYFETLDDIINPKPLLLTECDLILT